MRDERGGTRDSGSTPPAQVRLAPVPSAPAKAADVVPMDGVRRQSFGLSCAETLEHYFDYVTPSPEADDRHTDIIVQNDGGEAIPVLCLPESVSVTDLGTFSDNLLVQAFRRGLVLTGDQPSAAHPSDEVAAALERLADQGIDIRVLSPNDLDRLDWV